MSHGLWLRRYAGDPRLIGQAITIDGKSYTVIGILPGWLKQPGMTLGNLSGPGRLDSCSAGGKRTESELRQHADARAVEVRRHISEAQAEVDALGVRLEKQYPDSNTNVRFSVIGLREQITGRVSNALWILLGAVGCVLLIACANVANLLLARTASRQSEIAVRTALGATRPQLIREFLTECAVLSLAGGLLGLLLAYLGVTLIAVLSLGRHSSGRRGRH